MGVDVRSPIIISIVLCQAGSQQVLTTTKIDFSRCTKANGHGADFYDIMSIKRQDWRNLGSMRRLGRTDDVVCLSSVTALMGQNPKQ
jgi:hypothetical protein